MNLGISERALVTALENCATSTLERLLETATTEQVICTGIWGKGEGAGCLLAASCTELLIQHNENFWEAMREEKEDWGYEGSLVDFLRENPDVLDTGPDFPDHKVLDTYEDHRNELNTVVSEFDAWAAGKGNTTHIKYEMGKDITEHTACLTPAAKVRLAELISHALATVAA